TALSYHECTSNCEGKEYLGLFKPHMTKVQRNKMARDNPQSRRSTIHAVRNIPTPASFPPEPVTDDLTEDIVRGFCMDTSKSALEETGCACCGSLCNAESSRSINDKKIDLSLLVESGVTRKERLREEDAVQEHEGPVLSPGCERVCRSCYDCLVDGRRPHTALANGLWIGEVPDVLKGLSYAEMQLISKIRHNRAVVRVRSGRGKMIANAVMFSSPIPQVYNVLPPSREEINKVLAFTFLGTARPTPDDFKRTPMLVRLEVVEAALRWLRLNHPGYRSIEISEDNLNTYRVENPLVWEYRRIDEGDSIQEAAATSLANEDVDAPESGPCPFILKSAALDHLQNGGSVMGVGHEDKPEGIFDNAKAYPSMFPWLFPYRLGGIGMHLNGRGALSSAAQKKHLIMYHDKRFQNDLYFPMIAFNHEQIKASSSASNILLAVLNPNVLGALARRMEAGERVLAETDEERTCFEVMRSLD
ncbi:hypothetical protein BD626DRAFT_359004, partial [Schizophyllum amplum]